MSWPFYLQSKPYSFLFYISMLITNLSKKVLFKKKKKTLLIIPTMMLGENKIYTEKKEDIQFDANLFLF